MNNLSRRLRYCKYCNKLKFVLIGLVLFCVVVYITLNLDPHQVYLRDTPTREYLPCLQSPEYLATIVQYVKEVSTTLQALNITNFLTYGSLWGLYRFQGPLPWDHDADIGIIGDKNYKKDVLIRALEKKGFTVRDDWSTSSFKVSRGKLTHSLTPYVGIILYNNYFGTMKRPGLEPSLFFLHYNIYHKFPAWMVRTPLPTMTFGWISARVPRGRREILKYFYPFDWRESFLPMLCKKNAITVKNLTKFMEENVNNRTPRGTNTQLLPK